MQNFTPWTLLRRRLEPMAEELDRATPWRIEPPASVESWLCSLTWTDLQMADVLLEPVCAGSRTLDTFPFSLTTVEEGTEAEERFQERMAQQVMHRFLFAFDLSRRMSVGWRRESKLTGDFSHDAKQVLVYAWRTSAARNWARQFGHLYCERG